MLKQALSVTLSLSALLSPLAFAASALAVTPSWDTTGNYVITVNYLGTDYMHDVSLIQSPLGVLTGGGGSPAGANVYTWQITSGTVVGNTIDFMANYTATADAVTPLTTMHMTGIIAAGGMMSGTWSDNYQGGERTGTWSATTGTATAVMAGTLSAEDFGVVSYDSGLGMIKGYTAGFGLTDATMASATAVVVKLYAAGDVLLQTNTAMILKFNADVTGTQFSSPFDVSGTFNYATDGYWTNVRAAQYGQSVPAVKVVAMVTLANGKVVTAQNTEPTGDPTTIYASTTATTTPDGTLSGTVVSSDGVLAVTSVDMIDTSAIANGSFNDGWKYVFNITAPTSESNLAMKFSDWLMTAGSSTIPVGSHMRISSAQADPAGATILLTGANIYSSPALHMISDLNAGLDGRQVEITVDVAVPAGTPQGAYTTTYGVQSNP
jgi:hypothetical protein